MKFYTLLLFIVLAGFTSGDIHREHITIQWSNLSVDENGLHLSAELNFEGAAFPEPGSMIPVYFKSVELNESEEFSYVLENPVFEAFVLPDDFPGIEKIEDRFKLTTNKSLTREYAVLHIQISTLKKVDGKIFRLKSFVLKRVSGSKVGELKNAQVTLEWENSSALSQGKWVKISITEKGVYKIPYSKLTAWGFANPSKVSIYGSGGMLLSEDPGVINYDDLEQCAVWRDKNNGTDCLFFYAPGLVEWAVDESNDVFYHQTNEYSSKGFFFLTDNVGTDKNATKLAAVTEPATQTVTSANAYVVYENDIENVLQYGSGKKWYGDKFRNSTVKNIDFTLEDISVADPIKIKVSGIARSYKKSELKTLVNQVEIGSLKFTMVNTGSQTASYADEKEGLTSVTVTGNPVRFTLKYFGDNTGGNVDENAVAWLDYLEINYRKKLKFGNKPVFFSNLNSIGASNITAYSIENAVSGVRVFDVTDKFNVSEIPVEITGNISVFKRPSSELAEYVAFSPNGTYSEPELVGEVANQNLHAMSVPEFIIISHPTFLSSANRLADFHRSYDGMSVEVVNAELVYNEFSSGERNATGIRNFIKMLYDKSTALKYVLLFGDGSFDNREIRANTKIFIPTYQSENSLVPVASFVTDDYFAILDQGESVYNGSLDIGIGRIPASSEYEAKLVIDKIENYYAENALGNWRNVVSFIADDEDGSLHMSDSEKLATMVNAGHKEFLTEKIYLDAYQQIVSAGEEKYTDVTTAINNRVKDGVLILNYVGHANERFMADEHVLDISNVNSWSNAKNLPIFVTATCEFSRFDTDETSIGEYVLFNPNGGGIGLFSTTRLVFAYSNFLLSQSFYGFVFEADKNGNRYRMGDIMRLAKNNTINTTNKRNFSLLADPALRLSYPKHKVVTKKVNNEEASTYTDTIKALDKVTIEGVVTDFVGNTLGNFSGKMSVTVYDKATTASTLGNNGETPFSYKVLENIIYKGTASVTNGVFSFSFVVPKDISYAAGQGKIMYYADNGTEDAHGAFNDFLIGGLSNQAIADNQGPDINLFMDSEDFANGEKTSKNPLLLAFITDENGINTAGTGIGHDITAILDDDFSNVLVLNQYYQANNNDYTSGVINFPFQNLSIGKHKLTLKAWDVANNSSEAEIEFEVTGDFIISAVHSTPNPAVGFTNFRFEHNQADATLDVMIEIFDLMGRRIEYITTEVGSAGLVSNPVMWDFNSTQTALGNGIYAYRITARNNSDVVTSASGKMMISR
jgi:hypothetical protein